MGYSRLEVLNFFEEWRRRGGLFGGVWRRFLGLLKNSELLEKKNFLNLFVGVLHSFFWSFAVLEPFELVA